MGIKEEQKEKEKISILLEDLASLENYARDLFNFLPTPIFLLSSNKIILEANPAFEEITGLKTEEIIGKPIENFFDEGKAKELVEETLKFGFVKTKEETFFTKEKKSIPVSVSTLLRKSEDSEVIGFFFGIFDLREIKRKENDLIDIQKSLLNILEDTEESKKELERERNKTLTIINNFADGLLALDKNNCISLANAQAENLLRIKGNEIKGRSILELARNVNFRALINVLGRKIENIFRKEFSTKEGLTLEVSSVLMGPEEKELGSLIILHDISREKTIEKIKSEFVSLAAHQLRTPLSAIKWTLKMLLEGDLGKISKDQKEFVEKTYQSNERMISLINDLLDVTRIEEGRYLYKAALKNFKDVVVPVINASREEINRNKISLVFKKPKANLPKVNMDIEKMKLVVQNLIDNAVKYTPAGGKIVISLEADKSGKDLIFSIKDTGMGIPREQQSRVFTKFFRGSNAQRTDTEGTGLGLFISKNIIEAHDGRIWFESEEGKGTTFYLILPAGNKPA